SARNAVIAHNYQDANDVSLNGYKSYISRKINRVNANNKVPGKTHDVYFIGGIDPKYDEYFLTAFSRPINHQNPVFINNESDSNIILNETVCIDIYTGLMKEFSSFTPEYYGSLEGHYHDKEFISFKNVNPY